MDGANSVRHQQEEEEEVEDLEVKGLAPKSGGGDEEGSPGKKGAQIVDLHRTLLSPSKSVSKTFGFPTFL